MSPVKNFALVVLACDNRARVVDTKTISKIFQEEFSNDKKFKVSAKIQSGASKHFDCTVLLFSGKLNNMHFRHQTDHLVKNTYVFV